MSVPKLRFPEFLDAGEWDIKSLRDIAQNLDSQRVPITESDRVKGNIPYYGASGVIDYVKDYIFDEDLLCISEDGANLVARTYPIAFSISGKTWVNNHAHVLKFKTVCTQVIIENYLNSISLVNFLTGMAQPKLNRAKLDIIPIPLPSFPEQQKIADCLSSIDDRITAETQKLDTLKAHKKGLMQQLFPAEGETLPKLRFPEFRDADEWEVKKLEEVCDCIVPGRDKPKSFTGDIPWITIPDIQGLKIHSSINKLGLSVHEIKECGAKIVPKNSVIMSCVGTFGLVSICDQDLVINQQLHAWIPSPKLNNYYLAYSLILQKEQMERMATNTTIAYLNKSACNAITIPLPSLPEQQKIVDCLSSLDEAIAAQSQAIALLKLHKKGLMQQLFPSIEEVQG